MRNFLLGSVLLLTACSDTPVDNQRDSSAIDSIAVMTDTTLPHPQSTILDTVAVKSRTVWVRQDAAVISDVMAKNTPAGWRILDTMTGDLNRDTYADLLLVLDADGKFVSGDEPRPLLIFTGTAAGELVLAEQNDNVVLCKGCGGVFGDPYDGLAIRNGYFSVEHYGGSNWRWTKIITFKFNEKENTWLLHRDAGVSFNSGDPEGTETDIVDRKEDYGKLKFVDYNYN